MNGRPFPIGTALFFLFSVFTLLEIWVLVLVTKACGLGATILLTLGTAIAGAALAKRAGLSVMQKAQTQLANGQVPARPLAEGVMILVGGALLVTPGLITDVIGFSTLIPPCRRLYVKLALRWAMKHFQMVNIGPRPEPQIIEPWPTKEDD
jgi:UPF0716 protein FxsA